MEEGPLPYLWGYVDAESGDWHFFPSKNHAMIEAKGKRVIKMGFNQAFEKWVKKHPNTYLEHFLHEVDGKHRVEIDKDRVDEFEQVVLDFSGVRGMWENDYDFQIHKQSVLRDQTFEIGGETFRVIILWYDPDYFSYLFWGEKSDKPDHGFYEVRVMAQLEGMFMEGIPEQEEVYSRYYYKIPDDGKVSFKVRFKDIIVPIVVTGL